MKIQFENNLVRKFGESALLSIEVEKTKQAIRIGDETGLFYVPRILDFKPQKGILELERLNGLYDIHELIAKNDKRRYGMLDKLGSSIAAVHKKIELPPEMKNCLPKEWMAISDDNVFLHGDLSGYNICLHEPTNRLVIVDWSTSPLIGSDITYGPRYFDIVWFIYCMYFHFPAKCAGIWDSKGMVDTFIGSYVKNSHCILQLNAIYNFQKQIERFRRKAYWQYILKLEKYKYLPRFAVWCWKHIRYNLYHPPI